MSAAGADWKVVAGKVVAGAAGPARKVIAGAAGAAR
jgi:hypothetical protein